MNNITSLLEKEWFFAKNNGLQLSDFSESSAKKVWWQCQANPLHTWEARVFSRRKQGAGCPYCKGKKVLPEESLAELFPQLLLEWNYQKNKFDPFSLSCGSGKKIWWKCEKGHEWRTMIIHRTKNGTGCPYCCNQKTCEDNSFLSTNSPILSEWHPTKNVGIEPSQLVPNSHKKVWWKCPVAEDHEWETKMSGRFKKNGNTGCPCCAGRKIVLSNCLATTHPSVAKEWHQTKNEISAYDVTYASGKKAWFQCKNDPTHVWQTKIECRTRGQGCPLCASSKGEKEIKKCLDEMGVLYKREYRILECKNIRPLPFDFALFNQDQNLLGLIEFQGRHHYGPVKYFGGEKRYKSTKKNDSIKQKYCEDNDIKLLIIPFESNTIFNLVYKFLLI